MTKPRLMIAMIALVGAVLGAGLGTIAAPGPSRYTASAKVAFLPAPELTMVEASDFWEVLTRGQVTRTAAIVYDDPRWLAPAAEAAKTPRDDLTLDAAALPETTLLTVTVTASSGPGAEAALNSVLTNATTEVSSLAAPYFVKVLWPPQNSSWAEPAAGKTQIAAAGALGGLLLGAGIGWFLQRRRRPPEAAGRHSDDLRSGNGSVEAGTDGARLGS